MPSTASPADASLPVPPDFIYIARKGFNLHVLAARYATSVEQIRLWRNRLSRDALFMGGEGALPSARDIRPVEQDEFAFKLSRWRRAHSNVFPTSIWLDEKERMTWADQWNLTAEKLGRPKIPDRGRNWWWVEGRGLVSAASLLMEQP